VAGREGKLGNTSVLSPQASGKGKQSDASSDNIESSFESFLGRQVE